MLYSALVVALAMGLHGRARAAGALATDLSDGNRHGIAAGRDTARDAERDAMEECGPGCRIVLRFDSGCAAYAADEARALSTRGWANADTDARAQAGALEICRIRGGATCIVRAKGCETR